ncbi:hypothetical protein MPPM_1583 [Methylorubrum populi]|uniref:Uncharacterized protein n=1 Tax=Methylorubrum populi TaxID=223967 RepID=A0A161JKJ4_9HYPH|nr:hypothetical protein [Methylorubrum populi]BAU90188.1 hypothetical protein MPPM_1583 [Methylorubrum populi]
MNAPRLPIAQFVALLLAQLLALSVIGGSLGPAAAGTRDRELSEQTRSLEAVWHGCLREAYARQRPGQSRAGAQRNVLDECRAHEDRLVAATMREQAREDEAARRSGLPLAVRAGAGTWAWAASVAAYMVDPVTSWWQGWRAAR